MKQKRNSYLKAKIEPGAFVVTLTAVQRHVRFSQPRPLQEFEEKTSKT